MRVKTMKRLAALGAEMLTLTDSKDLRRNLALQLAELKPEGDKLQAKLEEALAALQALPANTPEVRRLTMRRKVGSLADERAKALRLHSMLEGLLAKLPLEDGPAVDTTTVLRTRLGLIVASGTSAKAVAESLLAGKLPGDKS